MHRRTSGAAACSRDGIEQGQTCELESFLVDIHSQHDRATHPSTVFNSPSGCAVRMGRHGSTQQPSLLQARVSAALSNPAALKGHNCPPGAGARLVNRAVARPSRHVGRRRVV